MAKRKQLAEVERNDKRKISKVEMDVVQVDRISELPDAILSSILSLLTMRDATRTSVLSSRWRYLWTSITNVNFDAKNMLGERFPSRNIMKQNRIFLRSVNWFLQLHRVPKLEAFRASFYFKKKYTHHLDRWIKSAVACGVEKLDLDFIYGYDCHDDHYEFPCQVLGSKTSSLKYLHLNCCILRTPVFKGFNSLKTLALDRVDLGDEDVVNLLSNCTLLERLSLRNCEHLVNLKITCTSIQLKYVEVFLYEHLRKLESITISATNLIRFEYTGHTVSFSFVNVPRLVQAMIKISSDYHISFALNKFPRCLPQLETLILYSLSRPKVFVVPESSPTFTNLKQLWIKVDELKEEDFLWLTSFLKASPFLERFLIDMALYQPGGKRKMTKKLPSYPHDHLKIVEISGFSGSQNEIKLAEYMLSNAIVLESMIIDRCCKSYNDGKWMPTYFHTLEIGIRASAIEQLSGKVRQGVRLEIL